MPWKPGQSGNPGGRSRKLKEFTEWMDSVDPECNKARRQRIWDRLYEIAVHGKDRDSKQAIELMAAYDMGRPVQSVETEDGQKVAAVVFLPSETPEEQ